MCSKSLDFRPIPGFSGTPFNLLVALRPNGELMTVRVLSQHEPVFVNGLGPEPLDEFVKQYVGKSLKQPIKVAAGNTSGKGGGEGRANSATAIIDGVGKATASIRIVNETVISSALDVARAKYGYAQGRDPSKIARIRQDVFKPMTWRQLLDAGYVRRYQFTNRQIQDLFKGTSVADVDEEAIAHPDENFIDVYLAEIDVPTIGRNILGDKGYAKFKFENYEDAPALMLLSAGRWSFVPDDFVPGAAPDRLLLSQEDIPALIRDFPSSRAFNDIKTPAGQFNIFKISQQASFDPAKPSKLQLHLTREKGQILPEYVSRDVAIDYSLPADFFLIPDQQETMGWRPLWRERIPELSVLVGSLVLLSLALGERKILTRSARAFNIFRMAFLAYTLVFIGWLWQGQLSIVQIIGLAKVARGDGGFGFLLYDPPTMILWMFTLVGVVLWGRGAFCGWLCPFGALQEFVGNIARLLRVPQIRVSDDVDAKLRYVKYAVLALIVGVAVFSSSLAERFAEVEPFKTSITLVFVRAVPYVAYAVALLALNAVLFKAFCRYLCPLGAALAVLGRLRILNWLPRRAECGSPCQLCRTKCRYDAIERAGEVDFNECFQCMDCVVIHDDVTQCVPLIVAARKTSRAASGAASVREKETV